MLNLNGNAKYQLAKSLTELAIQNNLINKYEDCAQTAKEVSRFFNTIVSTIDNSENAENAD